jgi:hypothetical protein
MEYKACMEMTRGAMTLMVQHYANEGWRLHSWQIDSDGYYQFIMERSK